MTNYKVTVFNKLYFSIFPCQSPGLRNILENLERKNPSLYHSSVFNTITWESNSIQTEKKKYEV